MRSEVASRRDVEIAQTVRHFPAGEKRQFAQALKGPLGDEPQHPRAVEVREAHDIARVPALSGF
ncbi:MAG: hypothetical protein M5R36_05755 [Deltaproteobacteria bacterium]|nr:hypothetical protein [Deltaproteobacteria bacterium]